MNYNEPSDFFNLMKKHTTVKIRPEQKISLEFAETRCGSLKIKVKGGKQDTQASRREDNGYSV